MHGYYSTHSFFVPFTFNYLHVQLSLNCAHPLARWCGVRARWQSLAGGGFGLCCPVELLECRGWTHDRPRRTRNTEKSFHITRYAKQVPLRDHCYRHIADNSSFSTFVLRFLTLSSCLKHREKIGWSKYFKELCDS